MQKQPDTSLLSSRREFLATAGAALAAAALPLGQASAQTPAKYHRVSLSDPKAPLDSYRTAIAAMLALPPSDPRNLYRNAFVHLLDCPHGNWWLLPWHRGFTGWFEIACRELSKDADFALPYWDWTAEPQIPAAFFQDDALNPQNKQFIASQAEFQKQLQNPMSDLWKSFSPAQIQQLADRSYHAFADLWSDATGSFFPRGQTRGATPPGKFDATTLKAVALKQTILPALAPTDFITFGSGVASQHSSPKRKFGLLEGQPHNLVHNFICGFMCDFLSPVDPLFFMHHSNLDRLWDVWTRKQLAAKLPTLPTGTDLANWKKEPFLFFPNAKGKTTAGDYATIGDFSYDYTKGSGDQPLPKPSSFAQKKWQATLLAGSGTAANRTEADVLLPQELHAAAAEPDAPTLVATVTLKPGTKTKGVQFNVLVNPKGDGTGVQVDDPSFAGSFSVFGSMDQHGDEPITFMVPIGEAVAKLRAANRLNPAEKLHIQVVATRKGALTTEAAPGAGPGNVADVAVAAF